MSGISEAYAANEAERQARRERAVTVEPGPEEQTMDWVLAGDAVGWGRDAIAALRIRASYERVQREREARGSIVISKRA